MNLSFSAQVRGLTELRKDQILAVFRRSTSDLASKVLSTTPVDTGYLASTFLVQRNVPLPIANDKGDTPKAMPSYEFTILGAELGDYITMGYSAVYGPRLEYGFVGTDALGRNISQAPRGWVRRAAAHWEQIVSANVAKVK